MHLHPRTAVTRVQSAVCVLAVTLGLTVAPALLSPAGAAESRSSATSLECSSAQASLQRARSQQAAAKARVVKAKKALKKAKHAHAHKAAKVRKAKKVLKKAKARYAAASRAVEGRIAQRDYSCSPTSPATGKGTGQKLSLLGLANGLAVGPIDVSQLTTLLDQLLPGVVDQLDAGQLTALLGGFNSGTALDPSSVLALLGGGFSPDDVTQILSGAASPELLAALAGNLLDQLSGLAGGFPVPSSFDPTDLVDTFAGIFGGLSADQLGSLLGLVTSALGAGSSTFDVTQLTDLIDSLVPGISDQFDAGQLTSMLGALNGSGPSVATLSNLLGGQFSAAQLQSVVAGTATPDLLASVIAQVMAQLATAGGGGLELPGALDAGTVTDLISTVTSLLSVLTGGGGVLPVVCGLIPIPLLCP